MPIRPVVGAIGTLQLLAEEELVVLGLVDTISVETVRQRLKNDIQPWIVKTWCVPPKANAEFVWHMEDVIQTYMPPYDPEYPGGLFLMRLASRCSVK